MEALAMALPLPGTCFVERGTAVYLVTNWEHRWSSTEPAVLIRLSPRHVAIYRALITKRRSQKSIWFALFAKLKAGKRGRTTLVPIELGRLTSPQLVRLAHHKLQYPVPSLTRLPMNELCNLVKSLYSLAG
jgi:hypothetical protein